MTANRPKRQQTDILDLNRARAAHATLGLAGSPPAMGDPLPPFWHYFYFWEVYPPTSLGRDGHPAVGGFLPETGLPRRMWAGGQLTFPAPARLGKPAEKHSEVSTLRHKTGRSGPLAIVTVTHQLVQNGTVAMVEQQDLVYREDPAPGAPTPSPPLAPQDEVHSREVAFNPTLLFRYSALTFNGHRIHYDRDYCRDVEGYPGLVVHGPLLAQQLIHFAHDLLGSLGAFDFRATSPLFDFERATLCARPDHGGLSLWVRAEDGRQIMMARARPAA